MRDTFDTSCTAANSGTASSGGRPATSSTPIRIEPPPMPATPDKVAVKKPTSTSAASSRGTDDGMAVSGRFRRGTLTSANYEHSPNDQ